MTTVSDHLGLFTVLLEDEGQWPRAFPEIDVFRTRHVWALRLAAERGLNEHPFLEDRWLSRGRYGPLPIGQKAISHDMMLRNVSRFDQGLLRRMAILAGDERLYVPDVGVVNETRLELLFLAYIEPGSDESYAYRVAYRATGYLEDPDVQVLIRNARLWWSALSGVPLPKGGRPRIDVGVSEIRAAYRKLKTTYPDLDVTQGDIAAELGIHPKTLRRRLQEAGETWPPAG